jgi:UPF0176 protein
MLEVYPVILFYKYVAIADPEGFAAAQREFCVSLGLKGRILIAAEGINGTVAGPEEKIAQYVSALRADARFSDIEMKVSDGDATTFTKLVIKVRREIVTLNAGVEITADYDNHLSPADWKQVLEEHDPNVVLVDVRNSYEAEAGKFENAVVCDIEQFRDLPNYLERLEHLKERKVLMYCTGGIRCEKASALFRSRGFKNVYQLHGGIMTYQEQFGNAHWLGECFVFDHRMTVKVEKDLVHISKCAHSGVPSARFVNCLHDPCHRLFVLDAAAEQANPDLRLCPECLGSGLTSATATCVRPEDRIVPVSTKPRRRGQVSH